MKNIYLIILIFFIAFSANAKFHKLGSGAVPGVNDYVNVMKVDTANNLLIVGGDFTNSGGLFTPFISSWDGTNWATIGNGFDDVVRDIIFFNNELYACGDFTHSGTDTMNHVAKWNGTSWEKVGEGFNKKALALGVLNNELYCGGFFTKTNGIDCDMLAKWNGTEWIEVGGGVHSFWNGFNHKNGVYTLEVFQGQLMVGGKFEYVNNGTFFIEENVAIWNGFSWTDAGESGLDRRINDFYVIEQYNTLVTLGFQKESFSLNTSARNYDGVNWLTPPFVDPLPKFYVGPYTSEYGLYTMEIYEDNYYYGGSYNKTLYSMSNVQWNPNFNNNYVNYYNPEDETFYSLDNGLNNSVFCMTIFQNDLYIGGAFTRTNDNDIMNHIVRWKSNLEYTVTQTPVSCNLGQDGSAYINVLNGVPPYTYLWDNGVTDSLITNVEAGVYHFTVSDSDGRVANDSIFISQPDPLSLTINTSPASSSSNGGTASAFVTGGNTFYSYLWSNGSQYSSISFLSVDTYYLDVIDNKGCQISGQAYVDTLILPSDTATQPIDTTDTTVAIIQFENNFKLFPNPTKGNVFISLNNNIDNYSYEIINVLGEKILNYSIEKMNSTSLVINMKNNKNGIYYVKFNNKFTSESNCKKMILKK